MLFLSSNLSLCVCVCALFLSRADLVCLMSKLHSISFSLFPSKRLHRCVNPNSLFICIRLWNVCVMSIPCNPYRSSFYFHHPCLSRTVQYHHISSTTTSLSDFIWVWVAQKGGGGGGGGCSGRQATCLVHSWIGKR